VHRIGKGCVPLLTLLQKEEDYHCFPSLSLSLCMKNEGLVYYQKDLNKKNEVGDEQTWIRVGQMQTLLANKIVER